ncbi:MAG: hypothetical protein MUQ52_03495, partial [Pirellulales bacterium]|nr:hypothetical protein [Pirellulales bacterium]
LPSPAPSPAVSAHSATSISLRILRGLRFEFPGHRLEHRPECRLVVRRQVVGFTRIVFQVVQFVPCGSQFSFDVLTNIATILFTSGDTITIVGQAIIHESPHALSQSRITPGLMPTWSRVITSDMRPDIRTDITKENTSP